MNRLLTLIVFLSAGNFSNAQIGYSIFFNEGGAFLYSIDLNTCEICQLSNNFIDEATFIGNDVTMLPNGNWIGNSNCLYLYLMSPPPNSSVLFEISFPLSACVVGSVYDELNDIVYVLADDGLYTFEPNTFTLTLVGFWPTEWDIVSLKGIHITNGVLYGIGVISPFGSQLFEIDTNDPSNSIILFSIPLYDGQGSSSNGFYYTAGGVIGEYDITTQTATTLCDYIPPFDYNTIDVPTFPLPDYDCICDTDAGVINTTDLVFACISEQVSINPATSTEIQENEVLQYILFTDLNDTLGTIIATSNTPDFIFDPATMTLGVIYYITSIAADDDGTGNADFTDPCFDIGTNAQPIQWVPEPTVTFTVANNEICENGCNEINATFTGIPPFTLTYQVGNEPEIIEVFSTANGNFEICIGSETGEIDLMATDLSDAVCCL